MIIDSSSRIKLLRKDAENAELNLEKQKKREQKKAEKEKILEERRLARQEQRKKDKAELKR